MKVSLVQFNPVWEDKISNQKIIKKLLENNFTQTDLLIFPEMTLTGFSMQSNIFSEEIAGTSFNFFSELALKYNANIFCGIIEKSSLEYFNTLLHINNKGELIKKYRKVHPFSFSNEDKFYSAGKNPEVTEIDNLKIGLSICYDLRFPELFRFYAKQKTQLIVNIANWPITRISHYRHLLRARAIENQCFVVGVNRVGKDINAIYNGFSSIFDPMGNELLAVENEENIFSFQLEINKVDEIRNKFPFLNDIKLI